MTLRVDWLAMFGAFCAPTLENATNPTLKMVFCFQNCSDLLWEKNVKAENLQIVWGHYRWILFKKWDSFFKSPNLKKKYSKSLSWAWNLNKLFTVMGGNFKFQVQNSDLEYFVLRFGDLKNESHFLKKRHLYLKWRIVIDY